MAFRGSPSIGARLITNPIRYAQQTRDACQPDDVRICLRSAYVVGHNVIARCLKVKVDVDPRRRRLS